MRISKAKRKKKGAEKVWKGDRSIKRRRPRSAKTDEGGSKDLQFLPPRKISAFASRSQSGEEATQKKGEYTRCPKKTRDQTYRRQEGGAESNASTSQNFLKLQKIQKG